MVEVAKRVRKEMKEICAKTHNSILRDSHEAVKCFSWQTIWLEYVQKMPTLLNLLSNLVSDVEKSKSLLCLIISMILKDRVKQMCLVQRGISVLMYGNGTTKQVCLFIYIGFLQKWKGFKLVGDNVDKNVRWSFQRVNYGTRSFHHFHAYAVLDRVDFSGLSDLPPTGVIDVNQLLPSDDDSVSLKKMLATLVTRFVCNNYICIQMCTLNA